jgi:hypothetical protein
LLDDLREYYRRTGISAEGFCCPYATSCRSVSRDFVTAREAFVGSEYERGTLPRVLFVSIDASSTTPGRQPSRRTLAYMRHHEETACHPERLPKTMHWHRTHEFAYGILAPVAQRKGIRPFLFRDIHKYFAHTNSAKCKDAAREKHQGPALLFNNCREFIAPEIRLLKPDILVTQGDWGRRAVDGAFQVVWSANHPEHPEHTFQLIAVDGRNVLRFALFHPRAFGLFNKQRREASSWYFATALSFLTVGSDAFAKSVES